MSKPECPGCRALLQCMAQLEAQVAERTRKLEQALRAGKRQAAPLRKGPPTPSPKTPGRKSGEVHGVHGHGPPPPSDQVAELHEANLPDGCPHCHGPLVEDDVVEQFQTDIPRQPVIRMFRIHRGHGSAYGTCAQGHHSRQTSDAIGAAASQIGPESYTNAAFPSATCSTTR